MESSEGFFCLDNRIPTEIFFPKSYTKENSARALSYCHLCDRETECLEIALRFHLDHGIFGGMRPQDRDRLLVTKALTASKESALLRNTSHEQPHPVYEFPAFLLHKSYEQNHSPLALSLVAVEQQTFRLKLLKFELNLLSLESPSETNQNSQP